MVFAVVLLLAGVVLVVAGIVLFANGVGGDPEGSSEGERIKRGFARVPYREMVGLMPRSVKVVTDADASHRDRVMASGAFTGLAGIVLICLAVVAGVAASL